MRYERRHSRDAPEPRLPAVRRSRAMARILRCLPDERLPLLHRGGSELHQGTFTLPAGRGDSIDLPGLPTEVMHTPGTFNTYIPN
jgi:hypothetical protein